MRVKRLYRVTATYADHTTTRDFQSAAAASHRASLLRAPNPQGYGLNYPAPTLVTVTVSDPITWPAA